MARALATAAPGAAQRSDGSVGKITAAAALPLSRLPEVPSMFAPSHLGSLPSTESGGRVSALSSGPVTAAAEQVRVPARAPGGTLASGSQPPVSDPPPVITVVHGPLGETLPSKDLPIIARGSIRIPGGVAPWAVILLVAFALIAGFLLGWAAGRTA
jgi:hypothetical protein